MTFFNQPLTYPMLQKIISLLRDRKKINSAGNVIPIILVICFTIIFLSGCTAFQKPEDRQEQLLRKGPTQKIFYAKYEALWRAIHQVLKYPIASENQDTGFIETEYVKMMDGFAHPETGKPPTPGTRYRFVFKLIRGKVNGRPSVRLVIDKQIELLKNFFSEPERIPSEGLEELALIYRIERELLLAEALEKEIK